MSQQKRTAFFISDGTGITAGALGQLLAHFPETQFTQIRIPFTDSDAKVDDAQKRIVNAKMENGERPIVIMSIGNQKLRAELKEVDAYYIDLFDAFIDPLGVELKEEPLTRPGVAHSISGTNYSDRMEAINFALGHDDGMTHNGLNQANVILVGVSRSGKTPTSIYLAMQFGIKAANYPLTPEDFERKALPPILEGYIDKIFGLIFGITRGVLFVLLLYLGFTYLLGKEKSLPSIILEAYTFNYVKKTKGFKPKRDGEDDLSYGFRQKVKML